MSRIVVINHVTLDGVMQAPASRDEDTRGGFEHGGWAVANNDEVMGSALAEGMAQESALLLGRRTYEDLSAFWPHQPDDNPVAAVINRQKKWVVSSTLPEPLSWSNSALLQGDPMEAVARLKERSDMDLVVLGSGELVQALLPHHLVDRFLLMIHPLVMGSGLRLFPDGGAFAALRLIDVKPTTKGVLLATYEPAGPAAT